MDHARSRVRITGKGGIITISVDADDPAALLASLNGAMKQLRVVSGVDSKLSGMR